MEVWAALMLCVSCAGAGWAQMTGVAVMRDRDEDQLKRAQALVLNLRAHEALEIAEEVLSRRPEIRGAHYVAALAALRTGDGQKARRLAQEALARGEETSELQLLVGVMATEDRKFAEARAAFVRAIELNPTNAVAFYNWSELLRQDGQPLEAIEKLQQAQQLEPTKKLLPLKIRLAQMEAGQGVEELELEVIKRQTEDDQTEDWLLTAAAIYLQDGSYRRATDALLSARRVMGSTALEAVLRNDRFFKPYRNSPPVIEILGPTE